jgi:hypothetical protein
MDILQAAYVMREALLAFGAVVFFFAMIRMSTEK